MILDMIQDQEIKAMFEDIHFTRPKPCIEQTKE